MDQTILRSCTGIEEMFGVTDQKFNPGIDVQSTNRKNQLQRCGGANLIMEEEDPGRTTAVISHPSLLAEKNPPSDISSKSSKEGTHATQDIICTLVPPSVRGPINTTSSTQLSSYNVQTSGNELAATSGASPEDGGDAEGRASSPLGTRTVKNYGAQSAGGEALLGTNAAEGPENKNLNQSCPICRETEDERPEDPDCNDIVTYDSQEELQAQRSCRNGDNDDYYDFIEEFLSEGALVNIESAQTYVDLETGTVRTSVEVSAEDEGMEVKHEAEWVTQFVRSRKHK